MNFDREVLRATRVGEAQSHQDVFSGIVGENDLEQFLPPKPLEEDIPPCLSDTSMAQSCQDVFPGVVSENDLERFLPPKPLEGDIPRWPPDAKMVESCQDVFPGIVSENDLERFLPPKPLEGDIPRWPPDAKKVESCQDVFPGIVGENDLEQVLPPKPLEGDELPWLRPKPIVPPDITKGLGQRQDKVDLRNLEEFAIRKEKFSVFKEKLYHYKETHWVLLSKKECRICLRKLFRQYDLDDFVTASDYDRIYELMLCNPDVQREKDFSPPPHCLNLLDGTLDLRTLELRKHNPQDDFRHCIKVYYEDMQCAEYGEVFESFVARNSLANPLFRTQVLEMVMLAHLGYNIKLFFVLLGQSNTGKTELVRYLIESVGRENAETIAGVHDFASRFTTSQIVGKLICTCLDLPDAALPAIAVGTMKQLVGDDPIKAEAKYQAGFTSYEKPLLIFCGNHPLQIPNVSKEQALLNRMVVIPFGDPVQKEERRLELYKLFLDESPYILAEAIKAYRDLIDRNFVVTTAEVPEDYLPQDSRESYCSVQHFVSTCLQLSENGEASTAEMFTRYSEMASNGEVVQLSQPDFSRVLSEVLETFGEQVQREKRVGPNQSRGYSGISFIAE